MIYINYEDHVSMVYVSVATSDRLRYMKRLCEINWSVRNEHTRLRTHALCIQLC